LKKYNLCKTSYLKIITDHFLFGFKLGFNGILDLLYRAFWRCLLVRL